MKLCAVIGSGPVGEYVAKRIVDSPELAKDTHILGLNGTQDWLNLLRPNTTFISLLQFRRFQEILAAIGAESVLFVGRPIISKLFSDIDSVALRYVRKHRSLLIPQVYLRAVKAMLTDIGVRISNPLEYFTELGIQPGLSLGCTGDYDGRDDFRAAIEHITDQPRWWIRQAFIVDQGRILRAETRRTDHLILRFGASRQRHGAQWPVLCKVPVPEFEAIDVPTIGPRTLKLCAANGVRAILVQGGGTLVMKRSKLEALATENSICVRAF